MIKILLRALLVAGTVVFWLSPVLADENTKVEGTGIWVYNNNNWSFALVNLTRYPLTYLRESEGGTYPTAKGVYSKDAPILAVGTNWQVDPFGTAIWNGIEDESLGVPTHYDGRLTICIKDPAGKFDDLKFDLVFKSQGGYLLPGGPYGTWISLSPHSSTQGWAKNYNGWAYNRWVTPVDDTQMHNIMTLINDRLMVALYSTDNKNLTLVVQQLYEEDKSGSGVPLWDDKYAYVAYGLDFVDNNGKLVPGPR